MLQNIRIDCSAFKDNTTIASNIGDRSQLRMSYLKGLMLRCTLYSNDPVANNEPVLLSLKFISSYCSYLGDYLYNFDLNKYNNAIGKPSGDTHSYYIKTGGVDKKENLYSAELLFARMELHDEKNKSFLTSSEFSTEHPDALNGTSYLYYYRVVNQGLSNNIDKQETVVIDRMGSILAAIQSSKGSTVLENPDVIIYSEGKIIDNISQISANHFLNNGIVEHEDRLNYNAYISIKSNFKDKSDNTELSEVSYASYYYGNTVNKVSSGMQTDTYKTLYDSTESTESFLDNLQDIHDMAIKKNVPFWEFNNLKQYVADSQKYSTWYGFMQMQYYLPDSLLNFMGSDFKQKMDFSILSSDKVTQKLATQNLYTELYISFKIGKLGENKKTDKIIKVNIKKDQIDSIFKIPAKYSATNQLTN